jgi:acyl carrier protein
MIKIIDILKDIRPEVDFEASQNLVSEGLIDSFDLVMLVSELDKAFCVSIPGEAIIPENFESVETIQALLKKCGAAL